MRTWCSPSIAKRHPQDRHSSTSTVALSGQLTCPSRTSKLRSIGVDQVRSPIDSVYVRSLPVGGTKWPENKGRMSTRQLLTSFLPYRQWQPGRTLTACLPTRSRDP